MMATIVDTPKWRELYNVEHDRQATEDEKMQATILRFILEGADELEHLLAQRRRYMVEAREKGATLRQIADVAGLSVEGVRKMIAG